MSEDAKFWFCVLAVVAVLGSLMWFAASSADSHDWLFINDECVHEDFWNRHAFSPDTHISEIYCQTNVQPTNG
jgi:hypothetical protein